ncbi:MAG: hypothetical protein K9W46_13515 [Candidatus Heimdallarchaeum endolithica]|uniref:Uncharacterized protein n=1 Tax=Candidatus Heimdallarchaeum endolithica TaxID=2876572 RepID=A0A9Y1FNF1_9ARCH|nr:MAG: hypothetical protein K9W46_13515 [Candidatus Heimdallarchaeum endolithica]
MSKNERIVEKKTEAVSVTEQAVTEDMEAKEETSKKVEKERKSESLASKIKEKTIKFLNYLFVTILYLKIIKPTFYGLKIGTSFLLNLGKNFFAISSKFFYKLYIVAKRNMEELSFFVHRFERAPLSLQVWITSVFVFLLISIWIAFGGRLE